MFVEGLQVKDEGQRLPEKFDFIVFWGERAGENDIPEEREEVKRETRMKIKGEGRRWREREVVELGNGEKWE